MMTIGVLRQLFRADGLPYRVLCYFQRQGEIPGSSAVECGNYLSQDLPMARWEAQKYLSEVLEHLQEENLNYPA